MINSKKLNSEFCVSLNQSTWVSFYSTNIIQKTVPVFYMSLLFLF